MTPSWFFMVLCKSLKSFTSWFASRLTSWFFMVIHNLLKNLNFMVPSWLVRLSPHTPYRDGRPFEGARPSHEIHLLKGVVKGAQGYPTLNSEIPRGTPTPDHPSDVAA